MLNWGKKDEFIQAMFWRSHSVHTRRFYEVLARNFGAFCAERHIEDVPPPTALAGLVKNDTHALNRNLCCSDDLASHGPDD